MTVFIWDASHFDGTLNIADLNQAYNQGIRVFTHKLGEGVTTGDSTAKTALEAARDANIPVLGGYWFNHGEDDPVAEADRLIAKADADEPWWRDFPYWIWQPDNETEPPTRPNPPSPAWVQANADRLVEQTGRPVVLYCPHWAYGSSLADIAQTYPLWDSQYGANDVGPFADLYPGDGSVRWGPWPGYPSPLFLQYGSNLTIAGHTTCDASAYRGSLDELLADLNQMMGVDMALTQADADLVAGTMLGHLLGNSGPTVAIALQSTYNRTASVSTISDGVTAIQATLTGLPAAIVAALPSGQTSFTLDDIRQAVTAALNTAHIVAG